MDEPSDVSDDDDDHIFDDTFILVDNEDDEDPDDDTEGAIEVMSLADILSSIPPPPRRRNNDVVGLIEALGSSPPPRRQNNDVIGLIEALGSSPPPPKGRRRMTTAGTRTIPRSTSSSLGHMSMGPMGPMSPIGPSPLRSPSWASQGSRTPSLSLARKSSMMSFKSLRRKVPNLSIGGGGSQGSLSLKEE